MFSIPRFGNKKRHSKPVELLLIFGKDVRGSLKIFDISVDIGPPFTKKTIELLHLNQTKGCHHFCCLEVISFDSVKKFKII